MTLHWFRSFASAAFRLFKNPSSTDSLLRLGDVIAETRWFELSLRRAQQKDLKKIIGRTSNFPSIENLSNLGSETVGRKYFDFMQANNLQPYLPNGEPVEARLWLRERSRTVHDILHVVLDLSIEVDDEIRLNSYLMFSLALPISTLIVVGGLFRLLVTDFKTFLRVIVDLRRIKRWSSRNPSLLLQPIENWLAQPIHNVRKNLGLVA